MTTEQINGKKVNFWGRAIICVIILVFGFFGMNMIAGMKKPPKQKDLSEKPLRVSVMNVELQDVPVMVTGFGQARPKDVVNVSAEVSGQVIFVHPRLETGEIIKSGELLFAIDDRDYKTAVSAAQAAKDMWESTVARLVSQQAIDRKRLVTLERNQTLARAEYSRIKQLYETHSVGTQSGVDTAERGANAAIDQADQLGRAVTLYPIQIKEAQSNLDAAKANLEAARIRLSRCQIHAPFQARIKNVSVEKGQFVSPGKTVLVLADDSILEILVSVDSRDARDWMDFIRDEKTPASWFGRIKNSQCTVQWTESPASHQWQGTLNRVVNFDEKTRTLTLSVWVTAQDAFSKTSGLPLADGMFCSVSFHGKTMHDVAELPRWAVSFENTLFVAQSNRLRTRTVQVTRVQGEKVYVSKGLLQGEQVIITRLVDPLENSLLDVTIIDGEGK